MRVYSHYEQIYTSPIEHGSVVTIGNFDGVHKGHQSLIQNCLLKTKSTQLTFLVCTFEPHPLDFFIPNRPPSRLCSPSKKRHLFEDAGADIVVAQTFDQRFASLSPDAFVKNVLIDAFNTKTLVVGSNFKFGHKRAGDVSFLKQAGQTYGFEVIDKDIVQTHGTQISSTQIRDYLADGDIEQANQMLGRSFEITGEVIEGKKVGGSIGFPTLNIQPERVILPKEGIYAAVCKTRSNEYLKSAVYIGKRPTLGHGFSIEAHLINFNGDMYGHTVSLEFIQKIRDDKKFDSLDNLKRQIDRDVKQINEVLKPVLIGGDE